MVVYKALTLLRWSTQGSGELQRRTAGLHIPEMMRLLGLVKRVLQIVLEKFLKQDILIFIQLQSHISPYIPLDQFMKSKQSVFEDIIFTSIKKAREHLQAGSKEQFDLRMKSLPTKIKQLDADPYMFIFDFLMQNRDCVDFVFTQYLIMMEENFLNPLRNAEMLVKHFKANTNLQQYSYKIISILLKIKQPNLILFKLFFELHTSIAMPQNILENYRYTGYRWLARAFAFKKLPKPSYIEQMTSGILKSESRNLPTKQDEQRSLYRYIEKIVNNMVITIDSELSTLPLNKAQKSSSEIEASVTSSAGSSIITNSSKPKFGFCLMCSKPADYYCKDTKIPVCGSECKKAHLNYISNNPSIDYQYPDSLRKDLENLLITNIQSKKNIALSIDYLCAIYMNSYYSPILPLPHRQLLTVPVIAQRVWLLYMMHYLRKGQIFQHIFADCLLLPDNNNSKQWQYVRMNSANYFLKISQNGRMLEVFDSLDSHGLRRIIPILLNNFPEQDHKITMVHNLINLVYLHVNNNNDKGNIGLNSQIVIENNGHDESLLRAVNHEKQPLQMFMEHYKEQDKQECLKKMMRFIIKNQQSINKNKLTEFVMKDDLACRIFLKQLLITEIHHNEKVIVKIRCSPLIDEIMREIFYFINTKISDKIYRLIQLLCEVLPIRELRSNQSYYHTRQQHNLGWVFSEEHTKSADTLFQFCYFILMIVTELHKNTNKEDKNGVTKEEFVRRVAHFDDKFAQKQKDYILGVYDRLVFIPFSQKYRGFMVYYPQVRSTGFCDLPVIQSTSTVQQQMPQSKRSKIFKTQSNLGKNAEGSGQIQQNENKMKQLPSSLSSKSTIMKLQTNLNFKPINILLHNWEIFYQTIMGINNQTALLYRCCSLLVNYPQLCQPFLQLLLNKIECSPDNYSPPVEEHLIPSISSILQEQPNCVGGSWKPLFTKSYINGKIQFLFDLSSLVHFSRQLTTPNFIWFVRNFCQHVQLSYNHKQCLKLLTYNISHLNSQKSLERVQILQKQMITLYTREYNVYYQLLFLQGVFSIPYIPLAITLLDLTPINVVTDTLLAISVSQIIRNNWQSISEYDNLEGNKKNKNEMGVAWTHILNKIISLTTVNSSLFHIISNTLKEIPQCRAYFQQLNIMHSIALSQTSEVTIDEQLLDDLHSFRTHIPQMSADLLQQFIRKSNIRTIGANFKYFWKMGEVYVLLKDYLLSQISLPKQQQDSMLELDTISDVLAHAHYIKQITDRNPGIGAVVGFSLAALAYSGEHNIADFNKVYINIVKQLVNNISMGGLQNHLGKEAMRQEGQQDNEKGQDENEKNNKRLVIIGITLYHYLSTLKQIIHIDDNNGKKGKILQNIAQFIVHNSSTDNKMGQLMADIQKIRKSINQINYSFKFRYSLWLDWQQKRMDNEGQDDQNQVKYDWDKPPGLLKHEQLCIYILCILDPHHYIYNILHDGLGSYKSYLSLDKSANKSGIKKDKGGICVKLQEHRDGMMKTNIGYLYNALMEVYEHYKKIGRKTTCDSRKLQNILFEYLNYGFDSQGRSGKSGESKISQDGPIYGLYQVFFAQHPNNHHQ